MALKNKTSVKKNENSIAVITSSTKTLMTFRYDFLKALKATGADVVAFGPNDATKADVVKHLKAIGVAFKVIPISNTGLNPLKDLILLKTLKFLLKKEKITHVFAYTLKPVIYGSIAAKAVGIKQMTSMMTGLGHLYTFDDLRTKILRFFSDSLLKLAFQANKTVFFQNKDDAQVLLDRKLLSPEKVTLVNGSGVNLKQFPQTPLPAQTPLTFLFVGRLLKSKGFYEYCEAVQMVRQKYPGMRYQVLGGHHPNPAQVGRAESLKLMTESGIDYLGEVDDVLPYLQEAHVIVLPSYREGTPKALLEALAVGRPLITTNVPGCCETVIAKENGALVHVKDPWAIADAMRSFIDQPEILKPMADASRQLAEEKFDVNSVNKTILNHMGFS